jgi:amidase
VKSANELGAWDAVETRGRLRAGDVSPEEVLAAAIDRARAAAPLGAIVTETFDRARKRRAAPRHAPLGDVPTFVKDLAALAGVRTTWGSRGSGEHVSRRSDRFVQRLEETGLVVLGKSATPELGLTGTTEPLGFPPCKNPWDPTRSTGGSSGGAACLVAAGVVPIAHASDGGGSIRIPSACCGVVGLKPSRFRLDMEGSNLLPINIAVDGVVSRSVRDTVAFHEAMERRHSPKRVPPIGAVRPEPARPLRIGVFVDTPAGTPVAPEVREAVGSVGRLCEELGHAVEEISCPFSAQVLEDFFRYWSFVAWAQLASARLTLHWDFDASRVEPWSRALARSFVEDRRAVLGSVLRLRAFSRASAAIFSRWDVLLSPTTATVAPPLGYLATDQAFETKRERITEYLPFTQAYNAAGAPAISLPLGRSAGGMPIGVQLGAGHGRERTLLELSLSLEAARPWPRTAPSSGWRDGGPGPT